MSLCARSRWTWRRASSPVIHWLSPDGSAILPSIDSASFSVIRGRPSSSRVSQPASDRLRGLAADAESHLNPRRAQSLDAFARRARIRVLEGDHDARRPRGEQQIGAGRPARALRGRRARASRRRSPPPARLPACCERDALRHGGARRRAVAPLPTTLPPRETMTQPTLGLGALCPRAASPSATASAMKRRSLTPCRAVFRAAGIGGAFLSRGVACRLVLLLVGDDVGIGPVGRIELDVGDLSAAAHADLAHRPGIR